MYSHYNSVGAYNSTESPYYSWYKFTDYPNGYKSWWGIKLLPEVQEEMNLTATIFAVKTVFCADGSGQAREDGVLMLPMNFPIYSLMNSEKP